MKIFPDIEILLKRYDEAQCGRLFKAMMAYAYRQELPTFEEDAPEWYVWGFIQAKIDQCAEVLEAKRENGKKGGNVKQNQAPASKAKQTQADASTRKQTQAPASKAKQNPHIQEQEQEYEYEQEQEQEQSLVVSTPNPYGLTDDELRRARQEQSDVETAARRVGLPVSAAADFDSADKLREEHGAANLLRAIDRLQGANEKSRNWRYVGGILRKEKARGYTWADKPPENGAEGGTTNPFLRIAQELSEEGQT